MMSLHISDTNCEENTVILYVPGIGSRTPPALGYQDLKMLTSVIENGIVCAYNLHTYSCML